MNKPESTLLPVLLLAFAAAAAALYPSGDPDVFFHLAAGRQIVESGGLPDLEPFCYPAAERPFVNHEWLFDVALWAAYAAGGDTGVVLFKSLLAAGLFALVGLVGRRLGAGPWPLVLAGLVFLPLFRDSLEARPHLAGYALAAATILCLWGLERGHKAWLAALALVVVLWVNSHGSFPLAVALWAIWVVRGLRRRESHNDGGLARTLWAGPVVILSCLANPWGHELLATVFHHLEPTYRELVPEWKPLSWGDEPARDLLYLGLAATALLSFLPGPNRSRLTRLALLVLFLVPAMLSTKFMLGLAVGAIPVLAANLTVLSDKWQRPGRLTGSALAVASLGVLTPLLPPWQGPALGFNLEDHPDEALDHAAAADLSGRLFNPFNHGGFCEFHSHPRLRTYIDGRAYVHGLDGIETYLGALADYRNFRAQHRVHDFDGVLVDLLDPSFPRLTAGLWQDPDFHMVWLDSHFALFVPADSPGMGRGRLETFEVIRPGTDPRYLYELPRPDWPAARREIGRVLDSPGGETLGRLLGGVLGLREAGLTPDPEGSLKTPDDPTRCDVASRDLEALVASRPAIPMFRYFLAAARACAGRCGEARREALAAGGTFPDAVRLAELIDQGRCRETP